MVVRLFFFNRTKPRLGFHTPLLRLGFNIPLKDKMRLTRHSHRPAHIYKDNSPYFITASVCNHRKLLDDKLKTQLEDILCCVYREFGWDLHHWVILDNHYHLLCQSKIGEDLIKIMNKTHNLSAQLVKAKWGLKQKVWSNYWDYCPRNERDYNIRLCYLLNNPYKHGYVTHLKDWQWSSFRFITATTELDNLRAQFREFVEFRSLELEEDSF